MSAQVAPAPANALCEHCGQPAFSGSRFCCSGCEVVHQALNDAGLTEWYRLAGDERAPARTTGRSYAELDDPTFHRLHVTPLPGGTNEDRSRVSFYLEDLRCTACVWLLEQLPSQCKGVSEIRVDLGRGRADVDFDPAHTSLSEVARTFDRLGHPVHPYRGADRDAARRREDRTLLLKLGVAGAAAGNIMLLAIALYAGIFGAMSATDTRFFRWASMVVAVPALSYAATPFFRSAFLALRSRRLHLDLPISLGVIAGLIWGSVNVVRDVGEIYFDSLGMLVFLLLVARWVQLRHHRRASGATELLLAMTPSRARRVGANGQCDVVPLEAIAVGDTIRVLAGEPIPVDGVAASGASALDAGLLTGESRPIELAVGDRVFAGTLNVAAPIDLVAEATGEATRVGKLIARLDELSRRRAPIQRFVDRLAGRFVTIVMVAAALTVLSWALLGRAALGVEHAMALLVVTCPCALALATPLAVTVALGRAARRGVLIRGADALERLTGSASGRRGTIVLDKTGTLTEGLLRLVSWRGDASVRAGAVALEAGSRHPVAQALVEAGTGSDHPIALPALRVEREEIGAGIVGICDDGSRLAVGSPRWLGQFAALDPVAADIAATVADGASPIVIARRRGDEPWSAVAVAGVADRLRPDAVATVTALAEAGWRVELLSGDDPAIVAQIANVLGPSLHRWRGGASPEDKLRHIEALRANSEEAVVMVGDGVNDAAALSAATCGIAVHGSAEVAIEAADVFIAQPGVAGVLAVTQGAAATLATIRRSLRFSLAYNLVGGSLAVLGVIHPLIGAIMMPLSSSTVLLSSIRSRAFSQDPGGA